MAVKITALICLTALLISFMHEIVGPMVQFDIQVETVRAFQRVFPGYLAHPTPAPESFHPERL